MEGMARLALVEQNVRDSEKFIKLLYELLRHINIILENPHDYEVRTIKSELLTNHFNSEVFCDYLKYIGFQMVDQQMIYPKEQALSTLRMAQAAIDRKINFCCGKRECARARTSCIQLEVKKPPLFPERVLKTKNPLLLKIEALFNNMLRYEDEQLQRTARSLTPLPELQLAALDRVRDHQRRIKTGEIDGEDLPFDIALLMELLQWFKHKFFKWVDKPPCQRCEGATRYVGSTSRRVPAETYTVELYQCVTCPAGRSEFPRYNEPLTLLRTRRGRCGEWANCFALLCRSLGYDTRYVYDTTDHVWCEVYDYDSKTWLHVDPCEAKLDAPLLYSGGWGKRLSYVIGVSRDDVQDVTWRYTTDHKQVLKRRNLCSERELLEGILTLRERRQRQVSEARRKYLAKRTLQELAQLMVERTAESRELYGRSSGAAAWRQARGESGVARREFSFGHAAGDAHLRYCCAADQYRVSGDQNALSTWQAGAYTAKDVFRKVEHDWEKVYLARQEGTDLGFVSWRLVSEPGSVFTSLRVRASHAAYRAGRVRWSVRFDAEEPTTAEFGESPVLFTRQFASVEVRAELSGGGGGGWQHAQLFRQPLGDRGHAFELLATLAPAP